jgi:hypothetical protein
MYFFLTGMVIVLQELRSFYRAVTHGYGQRDCDFFYFGAVPKLLSDTPGLISVLGVLFQ